MKYIIFTLLLAFASPSFSQQYAINGQLSDESGEFIAYANVVLYNSLNQEMVKVVYTTDDGKFQFVNINPGNYYINISYVGYNDLKKDGVSVTDSNLDLGSLQFAPASIELEAAVIKTKRTILEVKPDRMVFNVEGTINSAGGDGMSLLRKAPGVLVDNNDNITIMSRSGVMVFVDGKRLPLSGDDLTGYLRNLTAEQIDRIDIITNPGAKYEAEGNAGIIDIRLKKNKNHGTNGTLSGNLGRGELWRGRGSLSLNNRTKSRNIFGSIGGGQRNGFQEIFFVSRQNGLLLNQELYMENGGDNGNLRFGTDFYVKKNHTLGFLVSGNLFEAENKSSDRSIISTISNPDHVDSILVADNLTNRSRNNQSYNLNYSINNKTNSTNFDLDYGRFRSKLQRDQPNIYYNATEDQILSKTLTFNDTPVDIDIYTAKLDHERTIAGGKFQVGAKFSKVATDNTFLFYDVADNGGKTLNNQRSNDFIYDEMVYAAYSSYSKQLNKKWTASAGLRVEITDAKGDLKAYDPSMQEDPVKLDYVDLFPTVGISYRYSPMHMFSLNYGKRINRPDYNVLNPFREQLSELSYSKGNPFLKPEIVHNVEMGYTIAYRYNIKFAYSKTYDQITRLLGPDEDDPRAGFISWDNLADQTIYSVNAALPVTMNNWWNAFFNLSGSYMDNQADYGDDGIVDLQAYSYNIFQQHTFNLPNKWNLEVSGWFNGPGIWGGVFLYETSWSLNLGIQRKFLNDKLNVKLSAQDIFDESGWSGVAVFNGLDSEGRGSWDSQRVDLSVSYSFGNSNVKSRKRKTGLESESKRVNSGN